ncbi:MAG: hypothetical protein RLZZ399_497 [Verrucomicrobiota bacterium]
MSWTLSLLPWLLADSPPLHATGPIYPERWLDQGAISWEKSPEFFWADELRTWAKDFLPPEKWGRTSRSDAASHRLPPEWEERLTPDAAHRLAEMEHGTREADTLDFEDAIGRGRLNPTNPEKARLQHQAARKRLSDAGGLFQLRRAPSPTGEPRPPLHGRSAEEILSGDWDEEPSEFADYHRGARAFFLGEDHEAEARAAWEGLLSKPAQQRHYRSVWAAFMLGKLALRSADYSRALHWFAQTRQLAREGFADTAGLAADTYGWEARAQLRAGHPELAAPLYLTQLALGDETAIDSLKALIPDREGMDSRPWQPPKAELLRSLAVHPVLRRLMTLHVLVTANDPGWGGSREIATEAPPRCRLWLEALEERPLTALEDAQYIGWIAYSGGRYSEAARWLALANPSHPYSLWLKARLARRSGKLREAATLMANVLKSFQGKTANTGLDRDFTTGHYAAGDLAGIHLSRADFVAAMEGFWAGHLEDDAAFLADWVLSLEELEQFVSVHVPTGPRPKDQASSETSPRPNEITGNDQEGYWLRYLLGRRMVRNGRHTDARKYLPQSVLPQLERLIAEQKIMNDPKKSRYLRARSAFTAAWITRHFGMELMGTYAEPDGFWSGGDLEPGQLDRERGRGVSLEFSFEGKPGSERERFVEKPMKLWLPATAKERTRIARNAPHPNKRFHYRYVAADLAWKAATLLPDHSLELADVLNTAGNWLRVRDDKAADRFYQALEKRCAKTPLGAEAKARRWFVPETAGPWSDALQEELPPPN